MIDRRRLRDARWRCDPGGAGSIQANYPDMTEQVAAMAAHAAAEERWAASRRAGVREALPST